MVRRAPNRLMDGNAVRSIAVAQTGFDGAPTDPAPAASQYTPPTQSERFHHYVRSTFSVEAVIRSAAGAASLQGTNTPSEWGQGGEGYAKRFGNSFAQHIMRQTIMYGAADALHEDNRYIPSGLSGAGGPLKYAMESTFLARKDSFPRVATTQYERRRGRRHEFCNDIRVGSRLQHYTRIFAEDLQDALKLPGRPSPVSVGMQV
jgi:hypothetical protein